MNSQTTGTSFSDAELKQALRKYDKDAEELLKNPDKMKTFLEKVKAWLRKAKDIPVIGALVEEIITMIEMTGDYIAGNYRDVPTSTMLSIVAALIYALSPIDLIPDVIPVIGYLDDAAVIYFVISAGVGKDLEKYKAWRETRRREQLAILKEKAVRSYHETVGEQPLVAALLTDTEHIKLLLADDDDDDIPVCCRALICSASNQELKELGVESEAELLEFYGHVFADDIFQWSLLGKQPFMLEHDCKDLKEKCMIVGEWNG